MKLLNAQYFDIVQRRTEAGAPRGSDTRVRPPRSDVDRLSASPTCRVEKGFSLLEMLAALAILLPVMGTALALMSFHQKMYQNVELKAEMYESLRGATELMTQEIGQAGLVSLPTPLPTLGHAVVPLNPITTPQVVSISSATSMFVGEQLDIDTGASEELVTLTAVDATAGQITAIFLNSHASGAVIKVLGSLWNGVMSTSDGSHLKLLGDINSDGSLLYVEYTCAPAAAGGTLSRSITTVTPLLVAAGVNPPSNLLTNLIPNPNGAPCFQYNQIASPYTPVPATVKIDGTTYTYAPIWNVEITLSVQTAELDPVTHQYLTMTKSLVNIAPRNVLSGLEAATSNPQVTSVLQPLPPNMLQF